ncbi:hypothetical protein [uncultured Ruminococcus sp.]|uniref:hypothetical protein n=1 Tax=uncultured Ruminococcus sp. TaxID=165186 RepID=UPI0026265841|nr:hypothetical protein [uncultured Ruminococcus sp.]
MGLYEGIKDAIGLAQKADNADLIKQLLDLGAQALEMQDEIRKLKEENEELKKANDIESRIIMHKENYITLKDDAEEIHYCSNCWGLNHKLIPKTETGCYECNRKWLEATRR